MDALDTEVLRAMSSIDFKNLMEALDGLKSTLREAGADTRELSVHCDMIEAIEELRRIDGT